MTTIEATHPVPNLDCGGAPNGAKAKLRAAHRREIALLEKLQTSKDTSARQRGEIRRLNNEIMRLKRPVAANLPALVREHRAAVEDGVGNWGETEQALFKAVK